MSDNSVVTVAVPTDEDLRNANDCRMYEQKYPEVDDLVMVQVRALAEMGAYVSLLEYNNIEGMILLSELSRRRIRSISKLVRVDRIEPVVVLRVDKEKGYIDLSKRRVSAEDVVKLEEKFAKSKTVHSILRHVADVTKTNTIDLYTTLGWPLYKKYGHAHEGFRLAVSDPTVLDGYGLKPEIKDLLIKDINRRMSPQPHKIRADVEVTCLGIKGVDAIRSALLAGKALSTDDIPIQVKLIAPPLFVFTTSSLDKDAGIRALEHAIEVVKTAIVADEGELTVKSAPRCVGENDEKELHKIMTQLEQKNQEVDGDNDDE